MKLTSQVRKEAVHLVLPAIRAQLFAQCRTAAEHRPRCPSSILRRDTARFKIGFRLSVETLDLVGNILIRLLSPDQIPETMQYLPRDRHEIYLSALSNREIAADRRCQSAVSPCSSLLPVCVSRYTFARREFSVTCQSAFSHPFRSRRCRAVSSEPAFTLKTFCVICSIRRAMPKPCIGSRLSVFR